MAKTIVSINGPIIVARGDDDFAMHDMVLVGKDKRIGEVIALDKLNATIQVYEDTSGLKIADEVYGQYEPISVELGPGMLGNVFDGLQCPLHNLYKIDGERLEKGIKISHLDEKKKWDFKPIAKVGQKLKHNTILAEVPETSHISTKILYAESQPATLLAIAKPGKYKVKEVIAKVRLDTGETKEITMVQKWPVRTQRPYEQRLSTKEPLITGQRIIDSLFPIAKGGTAAIPGGFGTGKTMLQQQIAKWCDADIIIYIGCGERGNEMTQVLEEFPKLMDPKTDEPLMDRTILIANTSDMPVASRELSIYTGITMAEYYRDMGYQVAIFADSTSRWAEALRELSARLEEIPAEDGFPAYLASRLAEFYARAGVVKNGNGTIGSVSIIGAVSPQGGDFSEPVTQNTKRFIRAFWGLDRELAYSRHYPAIHWSISYSEYASKLENFYRDEINSDFEEKRQEILRILQRESELIEISNMIGQEVLTEEKKLTLEVAKAIRIGFLQQNALSPIDCFAPLQRQYKMMETILIFYQKAEELVKKGIPVSRILQLGYLQEYKKLKEAVTATNLGYFDSINKRFKVGLAELENSYQAHLEEGMRK